MSATRKNRVIASVQIRNVRLLKLDATGPLPGLVVHEQDANININYKGGLIAVPDEQGTYGVVAEFQVQVTPAKAGGPCFAMAAHIELTYQLPVGLEYEEDEMKEFVASNVPFNAWPYLRELVQSMTGRMGLAPVTLPLYRHAQALSTAVANVTPEKETKE